MGALECLTTAAVCAQVLQLRVRQQPSAPSVSICLQRQPRRAKPGCPGRKWGVTHSCAPSKGWTQVVVLSGGGKHVGYSPQMLQHGSATCQSRLLVW
jgi:hypothetical protein